MIGLRKDEGMPKNVAGQVVRGDDHWGRSREIDELWRKVERGSVLLTAPRRYGKTSLMYALRDRPRPDWEVVYLNVEHVEQPEEFANELVARVLANGSGAALVERARRVPGTLQRWVAGLFEEVTAGVPDIGEIKLRLRAQAPEDWRAAVEPFWRVLAEGTRPTLVILDELPVMITTFLDRDEAEAIRFLHWFRALRQQGGRLLVGGSVNIEPLLGQRGQSALLNDLERFRLLPFGPEQATELVAAVLQGEGQVVPPDLPRRIVSLLGSGVPFFLQVFVDELLSEARRRGSVPDARLAEEVLHEAVLGPRSAGRFSHYLERLRTYDRSEAVARQVLHEAATRDLVPFADVARIAGDGDVDAGRLLARLQSDWYLEREGDAVRFADRFVREWWRRNAPMGRRW